MSSNTGVFSAGDSTTVLTDLFPGAVNPLPPGVPVGVKLRVIVTAASLTCAWLAGREGLQPIIGRVDIALSPEDTAGVTHLGGQVGEYKVERGAGCSCGAAGLKNWQPFPGVILLGATRYRETVNQGKYSRP